MQKLRWFRKTFPWVDAEGDPRIGLTLDQLAMRANEQLPDLPEFPLTAKYVHEVENGRNGNPNALAVLRIAAALGVQPGDLYDPVAPNNHTATVEVAA